MTSVLPLRLWLEQKGLFNIDSIFGIAEKNGYPTIRQPSTLIDYATFEIICFCGFLEVISLSLIPALSSYFNRPSQEYDST